MVNISHFQDNVLILRDRECRCVLHVVEMTCVIMHLVSMYSVR